jgi:hypothetical protein
MGEAGVENILFETMDMDIAPVVGDRNYSLQALLR